MRSRTVTSTSTTRRAAGAAATRVQLAPALKKRTVLLRKLQEVFRRWRSQPVGRVIAVINLILRGWVNYFRVGNAARCFSIVRSWVERKVRRHMTRVRGRRGFGWKRCRTRRRW